MRGLEEAIDKWNATKFRESQTGWIDRVLYTDRRTGTDCDGSTDRSPMTANGPLSILTPRRASNRDSSTRVFPFRFDFAHVHAAVS